MPIQENLPVDRVLDALGDHTRRTILTLLREGPLPVNTIADHFPISRPAVSKHLRILQAAGLVSYHEQGTRNIFYLNPDGFRATSAYLSLFWDEALENIKRMAEENQPSVESSV